MRLFGTRDVARHMERSLDRLTAAVAGHPSAKKSPQIFGYGLLVLAWWPSGRVGAAQRRPREVEDGLRELIEPLLPRRRLKIHALC